MGEPNPSEREVYRFGEYRLDLAARRLTRKGEVVSLPPKAFELLQMLVRNADRAVTRTELLDAVWRDTIVEEGNLGWNMSVLRRALDDGDGRIVETVRGYGYRFGLSVERLSARPPDAAIFAAPRSENAPEEPRTGESELARNAGPALAPAPAPVAPESAPALTSLVDAPPVSPVGRPRVRPAFFVLGFVALAVLAVLGAIEIRSRSREGAESLPAAAGPAAADLRPALAVLPFENLSQKGETVWLATALAEMLNGELALEGRARTTPGESVARVTSGLGVRAGSGLAPTTLARLRRDLGIDLVVVGNYLLLGDGDGLRVDYRLQSASDGRTILAGSENGRLSALFDLVGRTGRALRAELPAPPGAAPPPAAVAAPAASFRAPTAALRAYAEGIDLRRRYQLGEARKQFELAISEAPDFALAHAALADLLAELGDVRDARAESRRALAGGEALAPAEKLAIEAKNRELEGRWAEAAALWRDLVRVDPAPIENQLALARALSHAGTHDQARATLAELARRPPPAGTDPRIELERGWVERYAQDFAAMRAAGERALARGRELDSGYVQAEALSLIAWADLSLGNSDTGLEACGTGQKIAERIGHNRLLTLHTSLCAWIEANVGRSDDAERDFRKSEKLADRDGNVIYQAGAVVALGWQRAGGGQLAEAGEFAARSLALASSVGDRERELNSLELVSYVAFLQADLPRAEEASVEALAKSRDLNIASRIALHLGALGRVRLERGDAAAALSAQEEAVRIFPAVAPGRIASRELDLARSRLEADDAAGAIEICDRIDKRLESSAMSDLQRLHAAAIKGRAEVRLGHSDLGRAAEALLDQYLAAIGDGPQSAAVRAERAELLAAIGETARAEEAWRQLLEDPALRELKLYRLTAAFRVAELEAARSPGNSKIAAQLESARVEARAAKLGRLLGERL